VAKTTSPLFKKAAVVDFFFEETQYLKFQARARAQRARCSRAGRPCRGARCA
jgi:hypothetical protein